MEFAWTDDQHALREALRRLLESRAGRSRNRELAESDTRMDADVWQVLAAEMGVHGLGIPEELGGSGGSLVELAITFEEMGRVLYGGPFLSTIGLAAQALLILGDAKAAHDYLPAIAAGEKTASVAVAEQSPSWFLDADGLHTTIDSEGRVSGTKRFVLDGADADLFVVLAARPSGPSWVIIEAADIQRKRLHTLDRTRTMATVTFDRTPGHVIGGGDAIAALARIRDTAAILLAAEQAGGAAAITAITAEYARTRRQFGRPIGSFQGVKHRLAEMAVRQELCTSAAYWAAWQKPGSTEQSHGAQIARSYCSDAFVQTGKDAIQLHGGIGFTWEHDAHLYLRRARTTYSLLGEPREHRQHLADLLREAS